MVTENSGKNEREVDPNWEAYVIARDTKTLPDEKFVAFAGGKLVSSGKDAEDVLTKLTEFRLQNPLESILVQEVGKEDKVIHMRSPRWVK